MSLEIGDFIKWEPPKKNKEEVWIFDGKWYKPWTYFRWHSEWGETHE
jgi:hypothetical protein